MIKKGNMIKLFPNIDDIRLPAKALCPPENVDAALPEFCAGIGQLTKQIKDDGGLPLVLLETQMQQQQQ
jgi:hypothetical protein